MEINVSLNTVKSLLGKRPIAQYNFKPNSKERRLKMPNDKLVTADYTWTCPVCNASNKNREQKLVDIMFEIAVRMQTGEIRNDSREGIAEYVSRQLRNCGFNTTPIGSSWGVLQ